MMPTTSRHIFQLLELQKWRTTFGIASYNKFVFALFAPNICLSPSQFDFFLFDSYFCTASGGHCRLRVETYRKDLFNHDHQRHCPMYIYLYLNVSKLSFGLAMIMLHLLCLFPNRQFIVLFVSKLIMSLQYKQLMFKVDLICAYKLCV